MTSLLQRLEGYELYRRGVGLLPPAGRKATGAAIWVKVPDSSQPLRLCNCPMSKGGNTCEHLKALGDGLRLFRDELAGDFEPAFERTLWYRLAKMIYADSALPCTKVKVQQIDRLKKGHGAGGDGVASDPAVRVLDAKGQEVAIYLDRSPARVAFLERTGKVGGDDYIDRADLLDRLALFQLSTTERQFEKHGMKSKGRAWAESFWYRLAYHAVRTWGDVAQPDRLGKALDAGTFHPAIDTSSGAFTLIHRLSSGRETLKITLPRKRVEAILELLRQHFPEQEDLQIHPVPLQSLFKVSQETELDLEVRPLIKVLQHSGEEKLLERQDYEKYRYGQLFYLRELGLLARLPRKLDREKKFKAPKKMRLSRSQVPAFLDEHVEALEEGSLVLDEPLQGLKIWKSYDRVEVSGDPVARDSTPGGAASYRLSVRYGFGDESVSLAELLRARRQKRPYFETAEGWVDLNSPAFAELDRLERRRQAGAPGAADAEEKDSAKESGEDAGDAILLSAGELIRLQAALEKPLDVTGPEDRSAVLRRLLDQQPPSPWQPPEGFLSELRAYQEIGVDWLRFLAEQRLGGLLCDDMGLGKTHQAMALIARLAADGAEAPFLVVCPTSVISHWRDKLRRFAPALESRTYHGPDRSLGELSGRHVLITSYGVLRRDIDKLELQPFTAAIFDEIQYLKNRDTISYEAAARLPVAVKLGLTGTPIENALGELKTLFDLVLPGYLGADRSFNERYERALVKVGAGMKENRARLDELRRLISPFVLRRLKSTVLDELPEKIEDVRHCALTPEQVSLYRQVLETRARPLVEQLRTDDGKPLPYLHIFAVLNLLKQICDHPALVSGELEDAEKYGSGKWELYTEILRESLDAGEKVVVFSQYLGMLELMARHLEKLEHGGRKIAYARLQGSTRAEERGKMIERFNTDPECRVFLASLKAGGTGIDLVGGSVVVHYDRWWNAAREDQATDRVHRIGQERVVQVFKLVTEGTLEERISAMIEQKRDLLDTVVQEDDPTLSKLFDRSQLLELLRDI